MVRSCPLWPQSLDKMTNAYVDKYMTQHDQGGQPANLSAGTAFNSKTLSNDELEGMIGRCVGEPPAE